MPEKKSKRKKFIIDGDAHRFLLLLSAMIVILLVILIFYIAATNSLYNNLFNAQDKPGQRYVVETLNYHSHQAPIGFPAELIKDKESGFTSSQEIIDPSGGNLKFVSFKSLSSSTELMDFYRDYLKQRLYRSMETVGVDFHSLLGVRAGIGFDVSVRQMQKGSEVAIYYWLEK